ncbi:uncharacterized protein LOC111635430 [Centruroides sculpturatus]|uniref:uncharacterized protein LOC111635430 n=1 Tax=Centruroides sculpturatus TaxID=218467 RepID=UPI000C6D2317|nr:uncharacterized protein LOC111635430 [Centruroides sculpturatus]
MMYKFVTFCLACVIADVAVGKRNFTRCKTDEANQLRRNPTALLEFFKKLAFSCKELLDIFREIINSLPEGCKTIGELASSLTSCGTTEKIAKISYSSDCGRCVLNSHLKDSCQDFDKTCSNLVEKEE